MITKIMERFSRILPVINLGLIMVIIGTITAFAAANTYEVIAHKDVRLSSVIVPIAITADPSLQKEYVKLLGTEFNEGSFGVPEKIKLSESNQHISIVPATINESEDWLASKSLAQVFIVDSPREKIFGNAVIYMRYNTSTTQYLGSVLNGDIINIVTTTGWQLGYQVHHTETDPIHLADATTTKKNLSTITVIMVDDRDSTIKSFKGALAKVGERI